MRNGEQSRIADSPATDKADIVSALRNVGRNCDVEESLFVSDRFSSKPSSNIGIVR